MKKPGSILIFALVSMFAFAGCSQLNHSSVQVPGEYHRWLDRYFKAMKTKNTSAAQEMLSEISASDTANLPISEDEIRAQKKMMAEAWLQQATKQLGDFKDYSVVACKVTTIAENDPAANAQPAGTHVYVVCKSNYSNKTATETFNLFKGPQDSEISVKTHGFEASAI